MLRRWIIRGLGIALLTLCVTAWVGSYFEFVGVSYGSKTAFCGAALIGGELGLLSGNYPAGRGGSGWAEEHGQYQWKENLDVQREYEASPYRLMGFAWHTRMPDLPWIQLLIPLWFPTILSAGFLWLAWRKTRPKYTGKGFPVEVRGTQTKA